MSKGHRLAGILLVIAAIIMATGSYPFLPDRMPVHWNAAGEVDGWTSKLPGVWLLPLIMVFNLLLFQVIGKISPKGFSLESFGRVVGAIQNAVLVLLLIIFAAQLAAAMGIANVMEIAVLAGTGGLFIVIGNLLGKTRKNFFIGIRTPWTLASEEVWLKTHRLAGWLFVLAGIVLLVAAPFRPGAMTIVVVALAAGLLPAAWSLYLYQRLEGFDRRNAEDR